MYIQQYLVENKISLIDKDNCAADVVLKTYVLFTEDVIELYNVSNIGQDKDKCEIIVGSEDEARALITDFLCA